MLAVTWTVLVGIFARVYFMWYQQHKSHLQYLEKLVEYPFYWRDKKIQVAESGSDPDLELCFNSGVLGKSSDTVKSVTLGVSRFWSTIRTTK